MKREKVEEVASLGNRGKSLLVYLYISYLVGENTIVSCSIILV